MLNSLYAKNFILLDELKIAFQPGLNVITGETGAGKSILIGALSGLLGERLTKEVVRSGSDKAILEAEFTAGALPSVHDLLQQNDVDDDEVLLIRREITSSGKGRCFINDQPVPVTLLQKLGDLLVDLHGQHEHQLLLQPQHHGAYLDAFLGLSASLTDLREVLNGFQHSLKELHETQARAESLRQRRDYLQFQYNEIHALEPAAGEDEALRQEENILRHAESIFEKTHKLYAAIYEAEGSVSETLAAADSTLNELAAIDPKFQPLAAECRNARIVIDELANGLGRYHKGVDVDPDRLEKIRSRLSALAGLKKKYGGDLDKVLAHSHRLRQELDLVDNLDGTLSTLRNRLEEEREKLAQRCSAISQRRRQATGAFAEQVVSILGRLGMEKARFDVALHQRFDEEEPYIMCDRQPIRVTSAGAEQVEFLMATNPGEGFKPLVDIASGGEISRVMLALKTLLAKVDHVPVLVFDEIDIGISGRIAFSVGRCLQQLSSDHQVLCITHLPQIACMGHHHLLVEKTGDDRSTRTRVTALKREERLHQIARLLGGAEVTPAYLESAKQLMEEAQRQG